jgi:hypothetical protein
MILPRADNIGLMLMSRPAICTNLVLTLLCLGHTQGTSRAIDRQNSKLTVHVSKAGLFSAFGDNHEVEAPILEGFVDEGARHVEFVVESRQMRVLDPQLPPAKRQQVQERMLGPDVLDTGRFPEIKFQSTSAEEAGQGQFIVRGQLSLHGVTRPIVVQVRNRGGHYIGTAAFKQREFGITPVKVGGGTVKVKDELKIDFEIRTVASTASNESR